MERDEQAQRLARLLAELDAADPHGDALDPNDLARLAAGRPSETVRAAIETRLGGEDAETVATIAAAAADRGRERSSWRLWAAAAAVLLAVLGGWLLRGRSDAQSLGDEDLVAAFSALHRAEAAAFTGIEPLLADERDGGASSVQRGGLRQVGPRGTVLDTRPTLRWQGVAGAEAYEVEVISDEGVSVLTTTSGTTPLPWPTDVSPLEAGVDYVLRVSSAAAGVRVEGGSAFRVADTEERARYERALATIDETVRPDLRAVVRAQTALRMGLLDEAALHLVGPVPEAAADLGASTRVHLDRRRGLR